MEGKIVEQLAIIYLIGVVVSIVVCLLTGHEEFFDNWRDHALEALGFSALWPVVVVAYILIGTMGVLVWVCKRYWVRRFVCLFMGHCWARGGVCTRCKSKELRKVVDKAVDEVYESTIGDNNDVPRSQ